MSKYTPGPWAVFGKAGYAGHKVGDCTARSVAAFPATSKRSEDERNANAHLIAAAPDLADFAHNVAGIDEHWLSVVNPELLRRAVRDLREEARAAIAKAEGGS